MDKIKAKYVQSLREKNRINNTKNKFMVIDYGKEQNDDYATYDLWDECNKTELKEIKISSKYILSIGDIIYINDLNNINNIIFDLTKENIFKDEHMNYKSYICYLKENDAKLANLRYLLIYEKSKSLNYIEGIDLEIIVDNYEEEIVNEKEALEIVLKKINARKGILYELVDGKYIERAKNVNTSKN